MVETAEKQERHEYATDLFELRSKERVVQTRLAQIAVERMELDIPPTVLDFGNWSCESPVGVCVYDDMEDPAHDECLACGKPEARK